MKKAILISIQPKWCEQIANGKKTVEVRKTRPKMDPPFKCYIYCTNTGRPLVWGDVFRGNFETELVQTYGYSRKKAEEIWDVFNGKVIGEFVCDSVNDIIPERYPFKEDGTCLSPLEIMNYGGNKPVYFWHISDLVIYDEPKELGEFWHDNKCPYSSQTGCNYQYYCFRAGENNGKYGRCGETLTHPPQSWCYVEEINDEANYI